MDETYSGPATIEAFTVFHHRDGTPRAGVIVARTPSGDRTLASVPGEDADTIARLTSGTVEAVGASGIIEPGEPLRRWQFA